MHGDREHVLERVRAFTRYGWLSKGFVFVIIGVLALRIATRSWPDGRRQADQQGALRTLADQPLGSILLAATAVGLIVFMLWNITQAVIPGSTELDAFGVAKRIGWFGLGLFYGALAVAGFRLAWASGSPDENAAGSTVGGSDTEPAALTARLLAQPGGRWVAIVAAIVIVAVALYHGYKGVTYGFVDDIDTSDLDDDTERWIGRLGVAGFLARGLVLGLVGALLLEAAIQFDPDDAVGLDGALRELATVAYGRVLLGIVGFGLIVAGSYDMVTFRRQKLR